MTKQEFETVQKLIVFQCEIQFLQRILACKSQKEFTKFLQEKMQALGFENIKQKQK